MRIDLHVAELDHQPPTAPDDDRWLRLGDLDPESKVGTDLLRAYLDKAKMPRGKSLYSNADVDPASLGRGLLERCYLDGDRRWQSAVRGGR